MAFLWAGNRASSSHAPRQGSVHFSTCRWRRCGTIRPAAWLGRAWEVAMRRVHLMSALVMMGIVIQMTAVGAGEQVPFRGTWTGTTTAADLSTFPVVGVIAEGGGTFNQLGRATMVSPHTTDVMSGETLGDQIFTAANGDTLTAYCAGFALPDASGAVSGTLDCTITSGTGRFEGATGSYTFALVATPNGGIGFDTVAQIEGSISSPGSRR